MATTVMRSERFPDLGDEVLFPRLSDAKLAWLGERGRARRRSSPARCSTSTRSATRRST